MKFYMFLLMIIISARKTVCKLKWHYMNFLFQVLAGLLKVADRADWRKCTPSKDEEILMAGRFKEKFKAYDPNQWVAHHHFFSALSLKCLLKVQITCQKPNYNIKCCRNRLPSTYDFSEPTESENVQLSFEMEFCFVTL